MVTCGADTPSSAAASVGVNSSHTSRHSRHSSNRNGGSARLTVCRNRGHRSLTVATNSRQSSPVTPSFSSPCATRWKRVRMAENLSSICSIVCDLHTVSLIEKPNSQNDHQSPRGPCVLFKVSAKVQYTQINRKKYDFTYFTFYTTR